MKTEQSDLLIGQLSKDIRKLVDLSFRDSDISLDQWISPISLPKDSRCWEQKQCAQATCPAFNKPGVRCWLLAGTMCGGKVQGQFAKKFRSCSDCEVFQDLVYADPLTEVEEHLVILVHNLKSQQEQINSLAVTDHLTGLHNRRYFDLFIELEIEKIKRNHGAIYLLLLDIDQFKKINDEFGHLVGDEILKECAFVLKEATRKSELPVRLGGDEFLIAASTLPGEENPAEKIQQRLMARLERWNQERDSDEIVLSLSVGYSVLTGDRNPEDVIREADEKMYENKRSKRH